MWEQRIIESPSDIAVSIAAEIWDRTDEHRYAAAHAEAELLYDQAVDDATRRKRFAAVVRLYEDETVDARDQAVAVGIALSATLARGLGSYETWCRAIMEQLGLSSPSEGERAAYDRRAEIAYEAIRAASEARS